MLDESDKDYGINLYELLTYDTELFYHYYPGIKSIIDEATSLKKGEYPSGDLLSGSYTQSLNHDFHLDIYEYVSNLLKK